MAKKNICRSNSWKQPIAKILFTVDPPWCGLSVGWFKLIDKFANHEIGGSNHVMNPKNSCQLFRVNGWHDLQKWSRTHIRTGCYQFKPKTYQAMPWHRIQYWAVQSQELSIYAKWYGDSCPYGPSTEAVIPRNGWDGKPFWGCSEALEILSLSFLVHSPRTFIRIERWCFPSRGLEETLKGCHWSQDNSFTWRNIKLRAL